MASSTRFQHNFKLISSVTTVSCCGDMLRECLEREVLAKILLDDERFFLMFDFIVKDSFDISSDAQRTFSVSLFN